MKLSDLELRKLKTEDKPYRVHDGRGLFIEVTPVGGKLWRWAYRFQGKQKKMGLGQYPEVSLKLARERHMDGRRILAMGNEGRRSPIDRAIVSEMGRVSGCETSVESIAFPMRSMTSSEPAASEISMNLPCTFAHSSLASLPNLVAYCSNA